MAVIDWMDPAGGKVDLSKLGLSAADEAWYREQAPRYFEGDTGDFAWMEPYRQLYGDPENSESFWETQAGVDWLKSARAGGDAERDRQAAADSDGFNILGLAIGIALTAFGVPAAIAAALEVPAAVGSAITGSLTSLITGGDALVGAATGFASGIFGGAGADAESLAAADVAGGMVPEFGTTAAYDAAVGATPSAVAGDFVNPRDVLQVADASGATGTMRDAPPAYAGAGGGIINSAMETGPFDQGQFAPQDVGLTPASQQPSDFVTDIKNVWKGLAAEQAPAPVVELGRQYRPDAGGGIINSAMDWVKGLSPGGGTAVAAGIAAVGGGLAGIGNRENAVELQKMKNAAALEQISATGEAGTKAKQDYLAYLRSLPGWSGKIGVRAPATARPLRRPDGSLVYGPRGLVVNAMGG